MMRRRWQIAPAPSSLPRKTATPVTTGPVFISCNTVGATRWPTSSEVANGGDSSTRDWSHLRLWIVRSRLGQKEAGDKELAAYLGQRGNAADPWPARIADFLLGKTRESDLMAAAASPNSYKEREQRTDAWFFAGMKQLLAGDKAAAADCFRKCLAMDRKGRVNYYSAQAELKALGP